MTTTFNDTYEIKSLIGRGGMSAVYIITKKLQRLFTCLGVDSQNNSILRVEATHRSITTQSRNQRT